MSLQLGFIVLTVVAVSGFLYEAFPTRTVPFVGLVTLGSPCCRGGLWSAFNLFACRSSC